MKRLEKTKLIGMLLAILSILFITAPSALADVAIECPASIGISADNSPVSFDCAVTGILEGESAEISLDNEPGGFSFALSTEELFSDGPVTVEVTYAGASPGSYAVDVNAFIGGENQATDTVELVVPEEPEGAFDLSARPSTRTVAPGESDSYTVTATFDENYSGTVSLSVSGLPSGATFTFDPSTLSPSASASSRLEISTTDSVVPGSYPLTIAGGDGQDRKTVEVTLIVSEDEDPPEEPVDSGFELSVDPEEIEVEPGESAAAEVLAEFYGECTGPVALSLESPDEITARLGQDELNVEGPNNDNALLEMAVAADALPGAYRVVVTGTGCDDEQQVTVTLIVGEVPLVLEKRQSRSSLTPGMTQVYTLRVRNEGNAPVTGVELRDTLDGRLTYVSDTSGVTPTVSGTTYTWSLGGISAGQEVSFSVTTTVAELLRAGARISNNFEVNVDQSPEALNSNTVTAVLGYVSVEPDGLRVTKRKIGGRPSIGGILTYRIEVENGGAGAVFGVRLIDDAPSAFVIPAGKTVRDGRPFSDPVYRGGRYTWELGNLSAGERTVITYQMVIGTNADSGENENCALAEGRDGGGNRVSGSDCARVNLDDGDVEWLGQITAKAYLDVDGNGVRNAADEPLEGIEFILVGGDHTGTKQVTDEAGETEYLDLESGQYVLALNTRLLEPRYQVAGDDARLVRLLEGEKAEEIFLLTTQFQVIVNQDINLCEDQETTLNAVVQGCTPVAYEWFVMNPTRFDAEGNGTVFEEVQAGSQEKSLKVSSALKYVVVVSCDDGQTFRAYREVKPVSGEEMCMPVSQ